jgi:hypothetical protein
MKLEGIEFAERTYFWGEHECLAGLHDCFELGLAHCHKHTEVERILTLEGKKCTKGSKEARLYL